MATTYTSTIQLSCIKEHTCVGCGGLYAYPFKRTIKGTGGNADKASKNARKLADRALASDVDPHPCPSCGLYQPDMIGIRRAKAHKVIFWVALILWATLLILRVSNALQANTALWAAVLVLAAATVGHLFFDWKNPNRDLETNRNLAAERMQAGTLRTPAVRNGNPTDEWVRPRRPLMNKIALVMLGASIAIAAAPELMRANNGWPLNPAFYPPVVGPGDTTRFYMPQQIDSVKGYWNGVPSATAREVGPDGKEIGPTLGIDATTNSSTWGQSISVKSEEKHSHSHPWVELHLADIQPVVAPRQVEPPTTPPGIPLPLSRVGPRTPGRPVVPTGPNFHPLSPTATPATPTHAAAPSLAEKTISVHVDLDVEFPEMSGSSTFDIANAQFAETATLNLAPAHAGTRYNTWWWQCIAGGGAMLLVAGVLLIKSARALQRLTPPTKIYT